MCQQYIHILNDSFFLPVSLVQGQVLKFVLVPSIYIMCVLYHGSEVYMQNINPQTCRFMICNDQCTVSKNSRHGHKFLPMGRCHPVYIYMFHSKIHSLATTPPTPHKVSVASIFKMAAFKWDFANRSSSKIDRCT